MEEGRECDVTFDTPVGSVSGCIEQVLGMDTWVAATRGGKRAVELVRSLNY